MTAVSAYIPCYNNAATLARAIAAIRGQTRPVDQLLVIDDGSSDRSAALAAAAGAELVSLGSNRGRGAARALAMRSARHELVLCCDATKVLDPEFVAAALPHFVDPSVAAVVGSLSQPAPRTVVERWRGRQLFRGCRVTHPELRAQFASWAALVRRSAVLAVGNYDPLRWDNEDGDLGGRLLAAGYRIWSDPGARVVEIGHNTLGQVLERYWRWGRWNRGRGEDLRPRVYARWVVDSVRTMAREDLRAGDPLSVPISLIAPHYRYWRSLRRRRAGGDGRG